MRIAQLSDCHLFADINKTAYGNINPYQSLNCLLQEVQRQSPDLIVFTGDISGDDSDDSYQHLATLLRQSNLEIPVRMVAGNHDKPALLTRIFPDSYRSDTVEEIGNLHCVFLNTHHKGTLGQVDLTFFAHQLKSINNSPKPVMIIIHHHPVDTGSWMDKHELMNRVLFGELLQQIERPAILLHGHIHHASEKQLGQVNVLSCPSTCWQWQMTPEFGVTREQPGFRLLELTAEQRWQSRIIRV